MYIIYDNIFIVYISFYSNRCTYMSTKTAWSTLSSVIYIKYLGTSNGRYETGYHRIDVVIEARCPGQSWADSYSTPWGILLHYTPTLKNNTTKSFTTEHRYIINVTSSEIRANSRSVFLSD